MAQTDSSLAHSKQIYIAVIGTGGVGSRFLLQLEYLFKQMCKRPSSPKLSLLLVARSSKILYDQNYNGLPFEDITSRLENSDEAVLKLPEIVDYLTAAPSKSILVDNTSSQEVADFYPRFLEKGISIVTPNKKGFSSSMKLWEDIFLAASKSGAHVFHESSVGAGLPIISTLKDLVETGDEIIKIEGVFSGTMSFLFNSFAPVNGSGGKWSTEVTNAKNFGFTEPDPRDDLNGLDVARKLTILARLVGLPVKSPTSFPVQSLIPKELESVTDGNKFLQELPRFDAEMEQVKVAAENEGKVVRYVGSITVATKEIKVGLQNFDRSNPIAMLKGSDNIISFYTKRYGNSPLIVQGAGAGGDVTAMGVSGDLIKVIKCLC
ncbi:Homoserine dehydrogenase [Erysiphe neolycopersici]|uniref:Homoserine dehydrogenase n=1 Tax=Erysiphe neolycopersici TaxID=212602 RepID=A0A420HPZ0_9PEZI|nr:Homoserine dehydrogenase [Erysiphe neolycopersici]